MTEYQICSTKKRKKKENNKRVRLLFLIHRKIFVIKLLEQNTTPAQIYMGNSTNYPNRIDSINKTKIHPPFAVYLFRLFYLAGIKVNIRIDRELRGIRNVLLLFSLLLSEFLNKKCTEN